jgi:hypothetical protein
MDDESNWEQIENGERFDRFFAAMLQSLTLPR